MDDLDIVAQLFNADGTRSGSELTVNTSIDGYQTTPKIAALADGRFAVAWTDVPNPGGGDGSGSGIRAQIFDPRESGADIRGNQLNDDLVGTGFGDTMKGGGGADRLAGMGGDDVLEGGAGADTLSGGDGIDTASYVHAATWVNASLRSGQGFYGDALGDSLSGIENLTGSDHSDLLTGDAGANVIEGGLGSDGIYGEDGDDTAVFSHNFNDYTVTDFGGKIGSRGRTGRHAGLDRASEVRRHDDRRDGRRQCAVRHALLPEPQPRRVPRRRRTRSITSTRSAGTKGAIRTRSSTRRTISRSTRTCAASGMNPLDHYHQIGWQQGRDPSDGLRYHALPHPQSGRGGGRRRSARSTFCSSAWPKAGRPIAAIGTNIVGGFDAEYYLLPQSGRGGGRRRSAGALQHVRLARRAQSERVVRHRRLSRALRRRGGRGRQSARSLRAVRLEGRPRSVSRLRHARLSRGEPGRRGGARQSARPLPARSASTRAGTS